MTDPTKVHNAQPAMVDPKVPASIPYTNEVVVGHIGDRKIARTASLLEGSWPLWHPGPSLRYLQEAPRTRQIMGCGVSALKAEEFLVAQPAPAAGYVAPWPQSIKVTVWSHAPGGVHAYHQYADHVAQISDILGNIQPKYSVDPWELQDWSYRNVNANGCGSVETLEICDDNGQRLGLMKMCRHMSFGIPTHLYDSGGNVIAVLCTAENKRKDALQSSSYHVLLPRPQFQGQAPVNSIAAPQQQQLQVAVPAGITSGQPFQVQTPTGLVQVVCPPGSTAGDTIMINVPTMAGSGAWYVWATVKRGWGDGSQVVNGQGATIGKGSFSWGIMPSWVYKCANASGQGTMLCTTTKDEKPRRHHLQCAQGVDTALQLCLMYADRLMTDQYYKHRPTNDGSASY